MATLTTGIVMMRWQILSALMMFFASTLNIQFRKSDYATLAFVSSGIGIAASCAFATGLLGLSIDFSATWVHVRDVMWDILSQTPPEWPMILT